MAIRSESPEVDLSGPSELEEAVLMLLEQAGIPTAINDKIAVLIAEGETRRMNPSYECAKPDAHCTGCPCVKRPKITINGSETEFVERTISYDDVVAFVAIEEQWHPPLPVLSVTYSWKGGGDIRREGILAPGSKPITVADGMRFSAYRTGSA